MYVSDHQKGYLSDIIHSANHTIQSETDHDRWKFLEDSSASFHEQLPTNDFDANSSNIHDSLLHGGDQILVDRNLLCLDDENMRRPIDKFSQNFHPSPVKQSEMALGHGDLISSPYIPGVKRRKSLPRKVICIPTAGHTNTSGNGRSSSGEVVPCDLWAWRKYGQKPIKGSPYPRGYYRCSSSKGCAARKQVERSRTNPNMLVITYTSEHNHPWPTQRNALAGSTRSSYPSKPWKPSPSTNSNSDSNSNSKDTSKTSTSNPGGLNAVKEEASETMDRVLYDTCMENDDLFAHLAQLESDPMNLFFEKSEVKNSGKNCKELDDAFDGMFDWGQSSFVDHSNQ